MNFKAKINWWLSLVVIIFVGVTIWLIYQNIFLENKPQINLTKDQTTKIENYISSQKDICDASNGGNLFTTIKVLGVNNISGTVLNVYVWGATQEYYLDNQNMQEGSGSSLPVLITADTENGKFEITGHKIPRDGNLYTKDIKSLFPLNVQKQIFNLNNETIKSLSQQNKLKAKDFYQI
jgi:hypothetical protein